MKKYRITPWLGVYGHKYYKIEKLWLFVFWFEVQDFNIFRSRKDAEDTIVELYNAER